MSTERIESRYWSLQATNGNTNFEVSKATYHKRLQAISAISAKWRYLLFPSEDDF